MNRRTLPIYLVVAVAALVIAGCVQPFDDALFTQVSDESAPSLSITTPQDGSSYDAVVLVEGVVEDLVAEGGTQGLPVSVTYEVLSTSISGSTAVNEDGTFSFSFSTEGLSGSITLRVEASDWNGNTYETFLTLVNEGSIASFSVAGTNKQVTITWDEVPLAVSYSVRYTGTGLIPSESVGTLVENVTSPLVIPGLRNGEEYSFLLYADHEGGERSVSEIRSAVPLSPLTLMPRVSAEYGGITLTWDTIPGVTTYQVWRSSSKDGTYTPITANLSSTEFTDHVPDGSVYYYAVRPAAETAITSTAVRGAPSPFPPTPIALLGSELAIFDVGRSIVVSGNLAYEGRFGGFFGSWADLLVYDISNPANPVEIGKERVTSGAGGTSTLKDIALDGSNVFLTTDLGKLHVVDVSDPAAPVEVFPLSTNFIATQAVEIVGATAYIADAGGGLHRTPANEIVTSASPTLDTYATAGDAMDVVVSGDYAFVAAGTAGLEIVDISGGTMTQADIILTGGTATAVALDGGYAYVSTDSTGLVIVDISTIGSSLVVGSVDTAGTAIHASVLGTRAYVSDGDEGLAVVDATDPANPQLVTTLGNINASDETFISGNRLYLVGAETMSLGIYQLNPYPQLTSAGVLAAGGGEIVGRINGVIIAYDGDDLLLFDDTSGAPLSIVPLASPNYILGLPFADGDHFYYPSYDNTILDTSRFDAIRIGSPSDIELLPGFGLDGILFGTFAAGEIAYVGGLNSVILFDISDPSNIQLLGFTTITGLVLPFAKRGDYVLGVTQQGSDPGEVFSLDVSNPLSPRVADIVTVPEGSPYSLVIRGDTAYAGIYGSATDTLVVVDISDPESLAITTTMPIPSGDLDQLAILGAHLFGSDGTLMYTIDISDEANPVISGLWDAGGGITSELIVEGERGWVSIGSDIHKVDLTP